MPLAATLTTDDIYKAFLGKHEDYKTFFHGHSYTGNPLGCAVALANLEVFRKERTLARLQPKIRLMSTLLRPLRKLKHVGDIRQQGFMVGIELVTNRIDRIPFSPEARIGYHVAQEAKRRGLLLRPLGHIVVLMPPLATDPKTLARMVDILRRSIMTVTTN